MRYIAQIDAEGFCYSVGTFPQDYRLRENQIDVTGNPAVTGLCYREGQWVAPEQTPEPTQLDLIEQTQLTIMESMADQYEEALERELVSMEVQATIYEELIALKGEA